MRNEYMHSYQSSTVFQVTYFYTFYFMKHKAYQLEKLVRLKNLIQNTTTFVCTSQSKYPC